MMLYATLAVSATSAAAAECRGALARVAEQPGDLAVLRSEGETIGRQCSMAELRWYEGRLSRALFQAAVGSGDRARRKALLLEAMPLHGPWQVPALLGRMQAEDRDYEAASISLQQALLRMDDPEAPKPPTPQVIAEILALANGVRALAPVHVRAARSRSDAPSGIAAETIGGLRIEVMPIPVEFVTGKAEPTPRGLVALDEMVEILNVQRPVRFALVGHTDPRGPDSLNDPLSRARAESVSAYLSSRLAYTPEIRVDGHGEHRPPMIDVDLFDEEERWQIMRRVELVRLP